MNKYKFLQEVLDGMSARRKQELVHIKCELTKDCRTCKCNK